MAGISAPAGDIVILAVPYASTVDKVRQYGDALTGEIVIDLSNTFSAPVSNPIIRPGGLQNVCCGVVATSYCALSTLAPALRGVGVFC